MRSSVWLALAVPLLAAGACEEGGLGPADRAKSAVDPTVPAPEEAPGKKSIQPMAAAAAAPTPAPRASAVPSLDRLTRATTTYFEGHVGRRLYIQVDKPLYRPGETIWLKTWDLRARDLAGSDASGGIRYELVNPKGAVAASKNVQSIHGTASNDFPLPDEIEGGEYELRVSTYDGYTESRPIMVSVYETPRIQKKLEFVRKAYGPGDEVSATLMVKRANGEPLKNHPLRATVWLDGEAIEVPRFSTNTEGGAIARFNLPAKIERGDALLTVLVDDAGITESVSKRVPIVLKRLELSFFPEGGQLVSGIPARLYFEAKNKLGKPADIEGRVVDDHGSAVATFTSFHDGLGRFDFLPSTGRTYVAEVTKPAGITEKYPIPVALPQGCVLKSYDDLDSTLKAIRVGVRCSNDRRVVVAALLRDSLLDAAALDVTDGTEAVVYLEPKDEVLGRAQGIARITLFSDDLAPLAERLVYRNRRSRLAVKVRADRARFSPRDQVALTIQTTDERGAPIPAELAISVVDDTVISFADDKTGHLLSRLFLEPEIPGKVEEPNVYFDLTEKKSAFAMDLLMGTRGWRRFDWAPVLAPPPPPQPVAGLASGAGAPAPEMAPAAAEPAPPADAPAARPAPKKAPGRPASPPMVARPPAPAQPAAAKAAGPRVEERKRKDAAAPAAPPLADRRAPAGRAERAAKEEAAPRGEAGARFNFDDVLVEGELAGWAPVRVFPAPTYRGDETGPRTDFRDTIFWAPSVVTGKNGQVVVTFYLSDAVTSFRIFAEGIGAGRAGRAEETIESQLPFSMDIKLPLEVSAGDQLLLPLTLTNARERLLDVKLNTDFGALLQLDEPLSFSEGQLAPNERRSLYFPLTVGAGQGKSKVQIAADASGLKDEFVREVNVVPLGFPQSFSASGTLRGKAVEKIDLGAALPSTVQATVKIYPSPIATMVSGLDALLREPYGCFEQTSSTNYPNVMVLQYLRTHDVADPELLVRTTGLLERGYKRLVGFETPQKGYEWFGRAPAHEALTAFGVVQFLDMKRVIGGVDDSMIERTAKYLRTRRDGKGGFLRDGQALDSFGRASPEVTNAYIVYAMTEAGFLDFAPEIAAQAALSKTTKDAYLLALAANTLLNVPARQSEGQAAVQRLASMQEKNGAWAKAAHSITRSTGMNLTIETTSLALLALMEAGGREDAVRRGIEWLNKNRGGYGQWGATQATVLALKAMTEYASRSRRMLGSGVLVVRVNGQDAAKVPYQGGNNDPLVLDQLGVLLKSGANTLELINTGKDELPYSMAIDFRTTKPATHPDVVVDLTTQLDRSQLKMGDTVRLTATLSNKTHEGQPMTLARVGLPGGLTFQNWQLKELRENGTIAFFETRAREVILYFRDLKPSEVKSIPIDLVAQIPGKYTGPASSAYLYYTNDQKVWIDGLSVDITR
ncbi:MAG: hypothetical protein IT384_34480 [Deltaproteobacteria bacterium]|nr:hypothetical protein [Deltaproteobacteria bacterium]